MASAIYCLSHSCWPPLNHSNYATSDRSNTRSDCHRFHPETASSKSYESQSFVDRQLHNIHCCDTQSVRHSHSADDVGSSLANDRFHQNHHQHIVRNQCLLHSATSETNPQRASTASMSGRYYAH